MYAYPIELLRAHNFIHEERSGCQLHETQPNDTVYFPLINSTRAG